MNKNKFISYLKNYSDGYLSRAKKEAAQAYIETMNQLKDHITECDNEEVLVNRLYTAKTEIEKSKIREIIRGRADAALAREQAYKNVEMALLDAATLKD